MPVITKIFQYSGAVEIAEVPHGTKSLDFYIWGGGGGSGGEDYAGKGGNGAAGHFVSKTSLDMSSYAGVKNITVSVGGGGGNGDVGGNVSGGINGKSLSNYSGGTGGNSGPVGTSGSGAGGGGATVITIYTSGSSITQTVLAIAGGGGGAGGAGALATGGKGANQADSTARSPATLGENGATHQADGGGAGGGGGGAAGGTGGSGDTGDVGGFGGFSGSNLVPSGGSEDDGSSINPGGTATSGYVSGKGKGGEAGVSGGNGMAILKFTIEGATHFKVDGAWQEVTTMKTKVSGAWKNIAGGYYKHSDGQWYAIFQNDIIFQRNYAAFGDSTGNTTSGSDGVEGNLASVTAASVEAAGGEAGDRTATKSSRIGRQSWGVDPASGVEMVYSQPSVSCFIAGTKIKMADGTDKNIEDVVVGDVVKGHNGDNTVIELDWVTLGDRKLYAFNDSEHYFFTSEHPFMTEEGWKSVKPEKTKERDGVELYNELKGELKVGDKLVTDNGLIEITNIKSKEINNPDLPLYNFHISNDKSYIADNYVVHNKGNSTKIICTKLFELGYLPQEVYTADQKFGEWLRENDPYAYFGYIKWASVVVEWMEKEGPQCMFWIKDKKVRGEKQKALAISWAKRIATPWAQHMAYRMGTLPEDNRAGRMIMKVGLFISRIIGKKTNAITNKSSLKIGFGMWAIFGLFYLLAGIKRK